MKHDTLSEQFAKQGKYNDLGEYQQLKVAKEMEIEGTAKYYEYLKRQHGEQAAIEQLKAKGYDPGVIGK